MSDRVARLAELRRQRNGQPNQDVNSSSVNALAPETGHQSIGSATETLSALPNETQEPKHEASDDAMEEDNGYNSDLKRDIAPLLAKAERKTDAALNRLILKRYQDSQQQAAQAQEIPKT
ncbi:hypothetical protein C7M61_000445 [Candidozyma pseudohaemuli]|uniref:Uncharacterized protein n=1 Tax=Candidozyma pseudohaemuli TaxID=418784 RepID=A0A2P7YXU0_9ASCO|nr:hypothetical protein C7M61_000445 [[Candida] pseudohaemulonii]PSK40790.1 hypothetical protein C7M61_000445 [[Candida] pseudohaemulonii]